MPDRTCPTCGFTATRWVSEHFERWRESCRQCHAEGRAHFRIGHKARNSGGREYRRVKQALVSERKQGHRVLTQSQRWQGARADV